MNLRQFTQVYDRLTNQLAAIDSIAESAAATAGSQDEARAALKNISLDISDLGTALLQNQKQDLDDSGSTVDVGATGGVAASKKAAYIPDECIICLERKPGSLSNTNPYHYFQEYSD